jgi:hypothetical protein
MGRLLAIITIILGTTVLAGGTALAAASAPEVHAERTALQLQVSHRDPLPVPAAEARIVLYGDSLAAESADLFREALATAGVADIRLNTFGGTAICDWLDRMQTDAAVLHPTAVVVEFSGNALTPCMTDASGRSLVDDPAAYHARYRADAQAVLDIFAGTGTRVYFAGAPLSRKAAETDPAGATWLNDLYASLAADSAGRGRYVDAGAATLQANRWTPTLPCLPEEPCTGGVDASGTPVNVVRAPDGGHFCPGAPDATRGVTETCPVWSSGAYRYANAMAAPVVRDLTTAV